MTDLPGGSSELLRECLSNFPALHTLGIVNDWCLETPALRSAFKHQPDYPKVRTVAIPVSAHPILARLPGVEEAIFFKPIYSFKSAKPVLNSFRGPYRKERLGLVEPVLKSFTLVSAYQEEGFTHGVYTTSSLSVCPLTYVFVQRSLRNSQGCASFVCQRFDLGSHRALSTQLTPRSFPALRNGYATPPWSQRTDRIRNLL